MAKKTKKSTVRHTRAIQRDRSKRSNVAPPDAKIEQRLTELIKPVTEAQEPLSLTFCATYDEAEG
jgi:hypothetical protein